MTTTRCNADEMVIEGTRERRRAFPNVILDHFVQSPAKEQMEMQIVLEMDVPFAYAN